MLNSQFLEREKDSLVTLFANLDTLFVRGRTYENITEKIYTDSRRVYRRAAGLGTAIAGLWERAEMEVQQTGEVSADVVRILLDLQGPRGIYEDPKEFESLPRRCGARDS